MRQLPNNIQNSFKCKFWSGSFESNSNLAICEGEILNLGKVHNLKSFCFCCESTCACYFNTSDMFNIFTIFMIDVDIEPVEQICLD